MPCLHGKQPDLPTVRSAPFLVGEQTFAIEGAREKAEVGAIITGANLRRPPKAQPGKPPEAKKTTDVDEKPKEE